jgi:hypothetical protein
VSRTLDCLATGSHAESSGADGGFTKRFALGVEKDVIVAFHGSASDQTGDVRKQPPCCTGCFREGNPSGANTRGVPPCLASARLASSSSPGGEVGPQGAVHDAGQTVYRVPEPPLIGADHD